MKKRKLSAINSNTILDKAFSKKNKKSSSEVSLGENAEYFFTCVHCNQDFKRKPNDFSRREAKLYVHSVHCGSVSCKQKVTLLNRKEIFLNSCKPSFRQAQPELAEEFISFDDPIAQELRTLDDVPEFSHLEANWQCKNKEYHQWTMKLSARSTNPNCPYCPGGDRTHVLDSIFQDMSDQNWLQYLDPIYHEKAKEKKVGSKEIFNFICKFCGEAQRTSYSSFRGSTGCKSCQNDNAMVTERRIKRIENGELCVADFPEFVEQYCFGQHDLPADRINKLSPDKMIICREPSVWWRCNNGHITSASTHARLIKKTACSKCGLHTSRVECSVYVELKELLTPKGINVYHRYSNNNFESDIFIITADQKKISIEIDGARYHRDPLDQSKEIKKDNYHRSVDIRTLRIREKPLSPISTTDKSFVANFKDHFGILLFILNDLEQVFGIDINLPQSLQHEEQAEEYYGSLRNVPHEESVGYLFPELLKLVDSTKTTLNLFNVRKSSHTKFPWLDRPNGKFLKWDKVSNRIRENRLTTPKELCNQIVTEENCFAATHFNFAYCFVDPKSFVVGTAKKVDTYCCHPHTIDENGNVNKHDQDICGVITRRQPLKVMRQIAEKGFCWNIECKHANHINITSETREKRGEKIKKANDKSRKELIKKTLGSLLLKLPLFVIKSLLRTDPIEIFCPKCNRKSHSGSKKIAMLQLKKENGYECFWCFGSGLPLNKKIQVQRNRIRKYQKYLLEFNNNQSDWKLNDKFNKYGISYEPISINNMGRELKVNLISPVKHLCKLPLNKIAKFDFSINCMCADCNENK